MTEVVRALDGLSSIFKTIPWTRVLAICNLYLKHFQKCINIINLLRVDKKELQKKFMACKTKLQQVKACAETAKLSVQSLLEYADMSEERVRAMKQRINECDLRELNEYVGLVTTYLGQSIEHFMDFKKAFEEAEALFDRTQRETEVRREQAQRNKVKVQAIGGTAAAATMAAGVTGGVVASVIAGVFTFGVGTIVGLSLTAVGAAVGGTALGVGTGVATHVVAERLDSVVVYLTGICTELSSERGEIVQLGEIVHTMNISLKDIRNNKK